MGNTVKLIIKVRLNLGQHSAFELTLRNKRFCPTISLFFFFYKQYHIFIEYILNNTQPPYMFEAACP